MLRCCRDTTCDWECVMFDPSLLLQVSVLKCSLWAEGRWRTVLTAVSGCVNNRTSHYNIYRNNWKEVTYKTWNYRNKQQLRVPRQSSQPLALACLSKIWHSREFDPALQTFFWSMYSLMLHCRARCERKDGPNSSQWCIRLLSHVYLPTS